MESKQTGAPFAKSVQIYLATFKRVSEGQWLRFCSLYCISDTFFFTVNKCIDLMEAYGGKTAVHIFVGKIGLMNYAEFTIKTYESFTDYIKTQRNKNMLPYDVTLVWGESIGTARKYISSSFSSTPITFFTDYTVVGWTGEDNSKQIPQASRINVKSVDFINCEHAFQVNPNTHMCGSTTTKDQYTDPNDYGSPLLDKDSKVIGIVSDIGGRTSGFIAFVRIHEVVSIIVPWKKHLQKPFYSCNANKKMKL